MYYQAIATSHPNLEWDEQWKIGRFLPNYYDRFLKQIINFF